MNKRIIGAAVLAATLLGLAPASATDAIYGVWGRDGHAKDKLEFYDCAGKLCAKGVMPLPDGSPAPQILRNAAKTDDNAWEGDLFNPENGKIYKGTITLVSPTKMTLKGCLVAFLCQSEGWTRISGPSKPAAKGQDGKAPKTKAHEPAPEEGNAGDAPAH